ncbi:MAG: NAD/FAD-binding protein [Hyphococcus sp.]|nr:MAG: NAD/FAD-binding protein [Marinicaulis sp.]
MPFDTNKPENAPLTSAGKSKQRIAIIGSGVSGLSAAWLSSQAHDVVIYEKDRRVGGHSNTVDVDLPGGTVPVDTGFIVFNEPSYPNFTALLDHIGVAHENSCMSFGVSIDDGEVEYSGQTLSSVFARRTNAASPSFWKMLSDIPRFHRDARSVLRAGFCEQASLGDFVEQMKYGRRFCEHFLKPMAAAIWSTPQMKVFDYPALAFLQFFENHGLLQVLNLPEWRTVSGGSRSYVNEIMSAFNGAVRLSSGASKIERSNGKVVVTDVNGNADQFDHVIIASHADAALSMLGDASRQERSILEAFTYQNNHAVLHLDESEMPQRRRAWSSWNYVGSENAGAVTYWMNRLQNLPCDENVFVTLNPAREISAEKIVAEFNYDHPMFNAATEIAQKDIWRIQGRGGVWYAGAHLGHGFHEDGLQSGLAVAEAIGSVRRPWRVENESGRLFSAAPLEATL